MFPGSGLEPDVHIHRRERVQPHGYTSHLLRIGLAGVKALYGSALQFHDS